MIFVVNYHLIGSCKKLYERKPLLCDPLLTGTFLKEIEQLKNLKFHRIFILISQELIRRFIKDQYTSETNYYNNRVSWFYYLRNSFLTNVVHNT